MFGPKLNVNTAQASGVICLKGESLIVANSSFLSSSVQASGLLRCFERALLSSRTRRFGSLVFGYKLSSSLIAWRQTGSACIAKTPVSVQPRYPVGEQCEEKNPARRLAARS